MSDKKISTASGQKGILAITDMPRIAGLLEQLASEFPDIRVVSDIHSGMKALEADQYELVILQNHISGLSGNILKKHLMTNRKNSQASFALLGDAISIKPEVSDLFDHILNLSSNDNKLEYDLKLLFKGQSVALTLPEQSVVTKSVDMAVETEKPEEQADSAEAEISDQVTLSATGNNRSTEKIILPQDSAFNKKLTRNVDELTQYQQPDTDTRQATTTDYEQSSKSVTGRRLALVAVVVALLLAVATIILKLQNPIDEVSGTTDEHLSQTGQPVDNLTIAGAASAEKPTGDVAGSVVATTTDDKLLNDLPSFILDSELVPEYSKHNPGWQCYQGAAYEYRLFRGKDSKIQAIQVIDRSGSGIQQSFYKAIIKELAGVDSMRTSSSEIKEGYEIRKGQAGRLQLIQYRDAQGGKLHGLVFTWP